MRIFRTSFLFFILIFFVNCPSTIPLGKQLNARIRFSFDITAPVAVYFATDRAVNATMTPGCSDKYYLSQGDAKLKFGGCTIGVPVNHEIGDISLTGLGDKDKMFQFLSFNTATETQLVSKIQQESFDEVLLFVHGFNVKFEEAILRSAQIKFDLKFPGPIVLYSWPAGGEGMMDKIWLKGVYETNFNNVKSSRESFSAFLRDLVKTEKKIHIIVHSMGHQLVLPVLSQMAGEISGNVSELILNAPDYETDEFKRILPSLQKAVGRITLYCSPGDNALYASSKVNESNRLGSCAKFDGVDVVNVNPIDSPILGLGHGYYSSRAILTDIFQTLLGMDVNRRLFIRKSPNSEKEDFILRK